MYICKVLVLLQYVNKFLLRIESRVEETLREEPRGPSQVTMSRRHEIKGHVY